MKTLAEVLGRNPSPDPSYVAFSGQVKLTQEERTEWEGRARGGAARAESERLLLEERIAAASELVRSTGIGLRTEQVRAAAEAVVGGKDPRTAAAAVLAEARTAARDSDDVRGGGYSKVD